jgi:hypothetical protein
MPLIRLACDSTVSRALQEAGLLSVGLTDLHDGRSILRFVSTIAGFSCLFGHVSLTKITTGSWPDTEQSVPELGGDSGRESRRRSFNGILQRRRLAGFACKEQAKVHASEGSHHPFHGNHERLGAPPQAQSRARRRFTAKCFPAADQRDAGMRSGRLWTFLRPRYACREPLQRCRSLRPRCRVCCARFAPLSAKSQFIVMLCAAPSFSPRSSSPWHVILWCLTYVELS